MNIHVVILQSGEDEYAFVVELGKEIIHMTQSDAIRFAKIVNALCAENSDNEIQH